MYSIATRLFHCEHLLLLLINTALLTMVESDNNIIDFINRSRSQPNSARVLLSVKYPHCPTRCRPGKKTEHLPRPPPYFTNIRHYNNNPCYHYTYIIHPLTVDRIESPRHANVRVLPLTLDTNLQIKWQESGQLTLEGLQGFSSPVLERWSDGSRGAIFHI